MKIQVNLATRPFVELRPYLLRLRWIMGGFVALSLGLVIAAHVLQKRLDAEETQMRAIKARTAAAVSEKQGNERRMRQPANAVVLDRAHFLNTLFLRKSFSWTAVMMDLETVLPSGVQVTSIEPSVTADGDVIIRMRVAGDRDRAVQFVRNLEHSKRFLQPRLSSEAVQAKDLVQANSTANSAPGNVEFEILANYNPLPEGEAYPKLKMVPEDASKSMTGVSHSPKSDAGVPESSRGPGVTLKPMPPMQHKGPASKPNPQTPMMTPQVRPGQNGRAS